MFFYKNRIFDALLKDALDSKGAVVVRGPKWCGKTTTAEQVAKSVVYMHDPESAEQNLLTAQTRPSRLLAGATPRLIDEWQMRRSYGMQFAMMSTIPMKLGNSF